MKKSHYPMTNKKIPNQLLIVRRKLGLTRKQVATALGYSSPSTIARHEQGRLVPPLDALLQLEILYRMPIAYLYQDLYADLRARIRQWQTGSLPPPTVTRVVEEVVHA